MFDLKDQCIAVFGDKILTINKDRFSLLVFDGLVDQIDRSEPGLVLGKNFAFIV